MRSLKDYLFHDAKRIIDCHAHMFGRHGWFNYTKPVDGMVMMVENSLLPEDRGQLLEPYFEKYWKDIRKELDRGHSYLCLVGHDYGETAEMLTHLDCHGIGEIKCYKHFVGSGKEQRYYDTDHLIPVLENHNKPVFIHWDLMFDETSACVLNDILQQHPDRDVVLCHCGVNDIDDQHEALKRAFALQTKHPHLWLEISWVALDLIHDNPHYINEFPCPDRVLVGVDMSGSSVEAGVNLDKRYDAFRSIYPHFNTEQNLKNLFDAE